MPRIRNTCENCGAANPARSGFCADCGAKLPVLEAPSRPATGKEYPVLLVVAVTAVVTIGATGAVLALTGGSNGEGAPAVPVVLDSPSATPTATPEPTPTTMSTPEPAGPDDELLAVVPPEVKNCDVLPLDADRVFGNPIARVGCDVGHLAVRPGSPTAEFFSYASEVEARNAYWDVNAAVGVSRNEGSECGDGTDTPSDNTWSGAGGRGRVSCFALDSAQIVTWTSRGHPILGLVNWSGPGGRRVGLDGPHGIWLELSDYP